ncbi:EAL domain-containing protein [Vibrio aquaticus]|uniref:EAL domain-containing protein n=1 Tax=Vibrio aquaticus TaxID=2496559 RepID=A0A3S0MG93_9VIBR|nr:EAL domain-containing protein [Vibrio aquaticus]RTZ13773.1 EAL domain-containing protein [Vibrio aquaticus]
MRSYSALITDHQQLTSFFQTFSTTDPASYLVQILSVDLEERVRDYARQVSAALPSSHIIGHSTRHTIFDDQIHHEGSLIIVSVFERTAITSTVMPLSEKVTHHVDTVSESLVLTESSKSIISFATQANPIFSAFGQHSEVPISGGLASSVDERCEWVLHGTQTYRNAVVFAALHGEYLQVQRNAFSEWSPIGGALRVTDVEGTVLKSLDYQTTYQIYQQRLAENHPIMLEHLYSFPLRTSSGKICSPREIYDDGGIRFDQSVDIGDEVRICYNHPSLTLEQVRHDVLKLARHNPESVFIYNCESRLEFLEGTSEIKPFEHFDLCNGSYCMGEIYRGESQGTLHHSMTYLALSEDAERPPLEIEQTEDGPISPLFHLIRHSIDELDQTQKGMENKLAKQAEKLIESYRLDKHTGLKNRVALQERLKSLKADEHVITIKLSNFHQVNEKYGYQVADELIRDLSDHFIERLSQRRGNDFVKNLYYIGTAEWAIVFKAEVSSELIQREFSAFADQMERINFEPYGLPDIDYLSVSITGGIASASDFPEVQGDELLLKSIDARRTGKERNTHFFNAKDCLVTAEQQQDKIELMGVVSRAILRKNIITYSQPIFAAHTREQKSQECLVRIEDEGNIISPGRFLPIIEGTHLYTRLSRYMLSSTLGYMADREESFSINLSPQDMLSDKTLYLLEESIAKLNDPYRLGIEVLESEQIKDFGRMSEICSHFKQMGVRLLVDDFGSGYSNIDEIIRLEPDIIKLDGSLIKTIDVDKKQRQITGQLVKLCQVLNAKTIAEFVHNQEVCNIAEDLGVDYLQGFYLAEPTRLF